MPRRAPSAHHLRQRERLLEITRGLVAEGGYSSVRLANVAEAARMSTPALYFYFRNREDLLLEVVRDTIASLLDDIAATDDPHATTTERLRMRFSRWSSHVDETEPNDLLLVHRAILDAEAEPALAAAIAEGEAATRRFFRGVLEDGIARGEVRPDADVPRLADLLNTCFLGIEIGVRHRVVESHADDLFEELLALVLSHVSTRP